MGNMVKVAICDDEINSRERLKELLINYSGLLNLEIDEFNDGKTLLDF